MEVYLEGPTVVSEQCHARYDGSVSDRIRKSCSGDVLLSYDVCHANVGIDCIANRETNDDRDKKQCIY